MSDPVLQGYPYYYYTCDRDPTSSEPLVFNGYSLFGFFWWNTVTNDFFMCLDDTTDALVWNKFATASNISSVISSLGWHLNTSRSYSQRSSPSFSVAYTPSSTNDCFVTATVNVQSTLLIAGTVLLQLNDSGSYTTKGEISISGLAATTIQTLNCIVPAGKSYQLINSSGTASIVSIYELTL